MRRNNKWTAESGGKRGLSSMRGFLGRGLLRDRVGLLSLDFKIKSAFQPVEGSAAASGAIEFHNTIETGEIRGLGEDGFYFVLGQPGGLAVLYKVADADVWGLESRKPFDRIERSEGGKEFGLSANIAPGHADQFRFGQPIGPIAPGIQEVDGSDPWISGSGQNGGSGARTGGEDADVIEVQVQILARGEKVDQHLDVVSESG